MSKTLPDRPEPAPKPTAEPAAIGLEDLVKIMERLRSPKGCPWDKEQDFKTLVPFVIEEAYEVAWAIDSGTKDELKEELGDLLFQIIFLARLAEEEGAFAIKDVIESSIEKMTRRHPHVFGDVECETSSDVLKKWASIKEEEKAQKATLREDLPGTEGYLSDVPANFPALMHAHKISKRAALVGFDWVSIDEVLEKVDEELGEFREALKDRDRAGMEEELGDLLFAVANVARFTEVDPENALRKTIGKFINRFHFIEKELTQCGRSLHEASLTEMEELWKKAKDKQ